MLTNDIIEQLKIYVDDEDASLWTQGDILNDNDITKDEVKKLAAILQQPTSKLFNTQFVAAETPPEQRRAGYSWAMYAVFTKIVDPNVRWTTMFSRDDWTLAEAKDFVRILRSGGDNVELPKLTHTERGSMKVGGVDVKGSLNAKGQLTVTVYVGGERDVRVEHQKGSVKFVFPPNSDK